MVRAVLLFILKLAIVSAALFILWRGELPGAGAFWPGGVEQFWLAWQMALLRWLHRLLGMNAQTFNDAWLFARGYVLSVVPYLGLMIVGGPLSLRERLVRGLYGLGIIALWQVATPLVLYILRSHYGGGRTFFIGVFPIFMFSYALPFVLWVVLSRGRIEQWLAQHHPPTAPAHQT